MLDECKYEPEKFAKYFSVFFEHSFQRMQEILFIGGDKSVTKMKIKNPDIQRQVYLLQILCEFIAKNESLAQIENSEDFISRFNNYFFQKYLFNLSSNRGNILHLILKESLSESNSNLNASTIKSFKKILEYAVSKQNIDINAVNGDGNTILHLAVAANNIELVNSILSCDTDLSVKNKYNCTPFVLAEDKIRQLSNKTLRTPFLKRKIVLLR